MKNRLISLLLISFMLLFCFAGCGEKTEEEVMEDIGKEASKDAITISLYLMSEKPVSAKQELLMEQKVNDITETDHTIHVDIRYMTPDEYYERLEKDLAKMNDYYGSGNVGKNKGNPVYTDKNGLPAVYYPPINSFDVDVFYLGGYEKYAKYKSLGYLKDLTEELNGSASALKNTINKDLIEQFKAVNGAYDAIPTNRTIGEYTYMLVSKDVLSKTKYSKSELTSLVSEGCQDILDMVSTDKAFEGYVPLYSSTGEIDVLDVKYFNTTAAGIAINKFSVLGGTYSSTWEYGKQGSYPVMDNVIASADNGNYGISEQIKILKGYEFNGYYGTGDDADKPFAVGYIKGGLEVLSQYSDDYEIIPVALPTLEHEDLYESLFAVSNYTNSVKGSTQILNMLNTDEEFRNLILYGVEGENYVWTDSDVLDENGNPYRVVSRQTKDADRLYVMDPLKTGNVSIAYTAVGENPLAKEYLFAQNSDIVIDYTIGFSFYDGLKSKSIDKDSFEAFVRICSESEKIYAEIVAANTEEALDAAIDKLDTLIASADYAKVMNLEDDATSPLSYYMWWLENEGLIATDITK